MGSFTLTIPQYMKLAFVFMQQYEDEAFERFASRWKSLGLAAFRQALHKGDEIERALALFVLGLGSETLNADLYPYLESPYRRERWISALCLGLRQDLRAMDPLLRLLQDSVSLEERRAYQRNPDDQQGAEVFWVKRFRIQAIWCLCQCDWQAALPIFEEVYQQLLAIDQKVGLSPNEGDDYDALAYGIGYFHDLHFFETIEIPEIYRSLAFIYSVLGMQHLCFTVDTFLYEIQKSESLQQAIVTLSEQHLGLERDKQEEILRYLMYWINERNHYWERERALQEKEDDFVNDTEQEENEEFTLNAVRTYNLKPVWEYQGPQKVVYSFAWSPDGQWLASAGGDGTVIVFNITTGKIHLRFEAHTASVNVVVWSPRGDFIASGASDNVVYVWSPFNGGIACKYDNHTSWILQGLDWSPDGKYLASGSWDGTVHVWEALTGKQRVIYRKHHGVVRNVVWSPDGTRIASGGGAPECLIHVWDAQTGETHLTYTEHTRDEEKKRVFPPSYYEEEHIEEHYREASSIRGLAWSPDKEWIASSGTHYVTRVWHAWTGQTRVASVRSEGAVTWSLDGRYLFSVNEVMLIQRWETLTDRTLDEIEVQQPRMIHTLRWAPDQSRFAVSHYGQIRLYENPFA